MRRIVVVAAALGLVSGLLGAFAFSALSDEASAALFAFVRETNVDANGDIRVHEQGTANVTGTVDVGNLPAVQDVNLLSMPSQGRTYVLLDDFSIDPGQLVQTGFVNSDGCHEFNLYIRNANDVGSPPSEAVTANISASVDGVEPWPMYGMPMPYPSDPPAAVSGSHVNVVYQVIAFPSIPAGGSTAPAAFAPFAGARITGGAVTRIIDATLYCLP
ncbi:MAG TPA: hypothetical protein VFT91_09760 [Dehalococcoidia bacterium]|nr:hypothetical protein [Dehalococcoidia bacterium]